MFLKCSTLQKAGADDLFTVARGSNISGVRYMKNLIARFANDESGATAIEYGLLAALIAVVLIAAVTSLGRNMSTQFSTIANKIGGAAS